MCFKHVLQWTETYSPACWLPSLCLLPLAGFLAIDCLVRRLTSRAFSSPRLTVQRQTVKSIKEKKNQHSWQYNRVRFCSSLLLPNAYLLSTEATRNKQSRTNSLKQWNSKHHEHVHLGSLKNINAMARHIEVHLLLHISCTLCRCNSAF
jgi:hypothetical protein